MGKQPKLVKEIPKGYEFSHKDEVTGKDVYKISSSKSTPEGGHGRIRTDEKKTTVTKSTNKVPNTIVPKSKTRQSSVIIPPTTNPTEDYVMLDESKPEVPPTQKVQSLRKDLTEEFPNGLESGYRSFRVPDLNTGGNYAKQKNVITDKDGMPVVYDFKQNKYVQTGEPNIHLNMPVQNDTPTIQDALKPNELPTKFDVVPERLRAPNYNKAKLTTPIVDTSVYKGFNDVGIPNTTNSDIEFQKEQEKNLAVPKLKKGGIVSKIKGYANAGVVTENPYVSGNPNIQNQGQQFTNTGNAKTSDNFYSAFGAEKGANSGVVGQTDVYGKAKLDNEIKTQQEEQAKQNKNSKLAQGLGGIAMGIGNAVYQKPVDIYADPNQQASESAINSTVDGTLSSVTPWYGLAMGASKTGRSMVSKDEYGDAKGGGNAAADELMKSSHENAIEAATKGDAAGTVREITGFGKMGRAITNLLGKQNETTGTWGDINKAFGTTEKNDAKNKPFTQQLGEINAANTKDKQNQFVAARNAGNLNPTITTKYNVGGNPKYDENKRLLYNDGQTYMGEEANGMSYKKGGIVSKIKGYSDGGQIKGKGTGKSDSILAKVEADSFVVPEENKEVAEEIREKYLGKPPKSKANLNQKGGEKVKLSNGEHLYTPEEKEELLRKGVNVDLLAPKADVKVNDHIAFPNVIGYATGGDILEEDTIDPTKELARLNKEKEDAVKAGKVESDAAKAARDKKIADFNAKVASYDRKADRKNKASEWEKKRNDSKTKLDALNKSYEDASKSFEAANTPTAAQKAKGIKAGALNDTQRKYQEDLLNKIQEAKSEFDNADRTYNYVKDDNNYDASGNIKVKPKTATVVPKAEVKSNVVTENVATTKPSLRVPKSNKIVVADNLPSKDIALTELKNDAELRANANAIDQEKSIANAPNKQAVINDMSTDNNSTKPTRKGGIMDKIGSIDPTSLIGIGQMYVGKNMLSDSKRPVDKAVIDPTYNANVDRALKEASFGLTPEQKFMAQQDIENNKRDSMRLGVNYAGGSGTQAFNLNRASINDAWKAKLGLGIADQEARMAKQKYADAMAADRASILASNRRQAYNDAMGTFNQTQAAGSELIGAGLQNTIGAYRYNKMMKQQDEINAASNPWLNYKA